MRDNKLEKKQKRENDDNSGIYIAEKCIRMLVEVK